MASIYPCFLALFCFMANLESVNLNSPSSWLKRFYAKLWHLQLSLAISVKLADGLIPAITQTLLHSYLKRIGSFCLMAILILRSTHLKNRRPVSPITMVMLRKKKKRKVFLLKMLAAQLKAFQSARIVAVIA